MQYASIVLSIDGGRVMTVMECLCGDYAVSPNPGLAIWHMHVDLKDIGLVHKVSKV